MTDPREHPTTSVPDAETGGQTAEIGWTLPVTAPRLLTRGSLSTDDLMIFG